MGDREIDVNGKIEIFLGGDSEHGTFVEALEFAVDVYKNQRVMNKSVTEAEDFK